MSESGPLDLNIDLALSDGSEGLDELEFHLFGGELSLFDPRVALLYHFGHRRLDLAPSLGQQDDVLVQQVPFLGTV